jgi:hypothetical protein
MTRLQSRGVLDCKTTKEAVSIEVSSGCAACPSYIFFSPEIYFRSITFQQQIGHLVPAADVKGSQDALDETFLLTNVSPQIGGKNFIVSAV